MILKLGVPDGDALKAKVAALEALVARLPKTADGASPYEGQELWALQPWNHNHVVSVVVQTAAVELTMDPETGQSIEGPIHGIPVCYSTREAAEAAKEKRP